VHLVPLVQDEHTVLLKTIIPGRKATKQYLTRYARKAKAKFRKDRRLNIRMSSKDLAAIQKRALTEGLPYQTLGPGVVANAACRSSGIHVGARLLRSIRRCSGGRHLAEFWTNG
jgi:hypothetical protein